MTQGVCGVAGGLDSDSLLRLYSKMLLIREFEDAARRLLAQNRIAGSLHLSIGQEAVAVGVCDVLSREDHITSTHRGHGHCLAKGGRADRMMAELFAKATGYCGGRSGSMHIADPLSGILGANAIVGGGIPIAVGSAFASKVRSDGKVTVAFFGEGAVAEGVFHESLNLAALWQLPVIFVCENNQYAEMSHVSLHLSAENVVDFAKPYRIPGELLDGNDVVCVREAATKAVERARSGNGPTLLECKTYRWYGHFEGDQQRYRPKEEVEQWRGQDPLQRTRDLCLAAPDIDEIDLSQVEAAARREIEEAIEWADSSPDASPGELSNNVYTDDTMFSLSAGASRALRRV